jgi:hypothetical protein
VQSQHIVKNRILRQLSADEHKSIQPWLMPMQLRPSAVLQEQGAAIHRIYFPLSGMISVLAIMQTGEAIETGIIGAEGLLGGDAPINGHLFANATVQLEGDALTMPKARFVDAYHAHPHLRELVNRYQSILLMLNEARGRPHSAAPPGWLPPGSPLQQCHTTHKQSCPLHCGTSMRSSSALGPDSVIRRCRLDVHSTQSSTQGER